MDPLSKRLTWNLITSLRSDKAIIISTHRYSICNHCLPHNSLSMDECEAVASRIGIMKHGELVAIGTAQRLKASYSGGYDVQIKTKKNFEVGKLFSSVFSDAEIIATHGGILLNWKNKIKISITSSDMIEYKLPHGNYELSDIFARLHSLVNYLEDFSISQATLEQVFVKLAKKEQVESRRGSGVDSV